MEIKVVMSWTGIFFYFMSIYILYLSKVASKKVALNTDWVRIINWCVTWEVVLLAKRLIIISGVEGILLDNNLLEKLLNNFLSISLSIISLIISSLIINIRKKILSEKYLINALYLSIGLSISILLLISISSRSELNLNERYFHYLKYMVDAIYVLSTVTLLIVTVNHFLKEGILSISIIISPLVIFIIVWYLLFVFEFRYVISVYDNYPEFRYVIGRLSSMVHSLLLITISFIPIVTLIKKNQYMKDNSFDRKLCINSEYFIEWKGRTIKIPKKSFIIFLEIVISSIDKDKKYFNMDKRQITASVVDYPDISRLRSILKANNVDLNINLYHGKNRCYFIDIDTEDVYLSDRIKALGGLSTQPDPESF